MSVKRTTKGILQRISCNQGELRIKKSTSELQLCCDMCGKHEKGRVTSCLEGVKQAVLALM